MNPLTSAERRTLRARAHALNPVVSIGQHGLTPAVLHEIDVALLAHELIKIRVWNDDRAAREALYAEVCAELDAAPVQHIGKLVVVWRPAPEPEPVAPPPAARRKAATTRAAANKPGARPNRGKPAAKPASKAPAADVRRRAPAAQFAPVPTRRRLGAPQGRAAPTAPAAQGSRPPRRRRAP